MVNLTPKVHLKAPLAPPLLRPPTQVEPAPAQEQRQRSASRGMVSIDSSEAGRSGSSISDDSAFVLMKPSSSRQSISIGNRSGMLMPRPRPLRRRNRQEATEIARSMLELCVPSERELLSIPDIEPEDEESNSNQPGPRWRLKKRVKREDAPERQENGANPPPNHVRLPMKFPLPGDVFLPGF